MALSQTFLPTSWDCSPNTLPTGWTHNLSDYYVSSSYYHSPPNAAKFDATGMYIRIQFVDKPDTLIYYLRGASFSGGTFVIQQSSDGVSWSAVRTFTSSNIPNGSLGSAAPFKDILLSTSRYVRFLYSNKSSGNVSVDDIGITKKAPGPQAEMKLKVQGISVLPGGTAITGNSVIINCKVINNGTDSTLRLTAASLSGVDASMFTLYGIPLNVPPLDSATFTINFVPTGADGTKTAGVSINNNDQFNNPYFFNLWAVKGCCATEPGNNASNLSLTEIKSYSVKVSFSDGAVAPEKYLVLKKSSPINEFPYDGTHYLLGEYIGDAQVAYIGSAGSFYPNSVIAGTSYFFKVFPFNGYPGYENYLTQSPAQAHLTTPANMIGTYYTGINISSSTLWNDLHSLINNHLNLSYGDYSTYLVNSFESRDTVVNNQSVKAITCAYSGEKHTYTEPFSFLIYSREHAFCQSWMPTSTNTDFTSFPEYSDYHNLLPVNQNKVNVYRSNFPMGIVKTVQYQYLNCKKGLDSLNRVVFEPKDDIKGDVARNMFYQVLCYDGVSGNDWYLPVIISSTSIPYGQDEALLKKWNQQDPPDNWEIARNDYIHAVQGNRNPFIDFPNWVNWFGFGVNSSIREQASSNPIEIYPNPASDYIYIKSKQTNDLNFVLYNIQSVPVINEIIPSGPEIKVATTGLAEGVYFYSISSDRELLHRGKIVIRKY